MRRRTLALASALVIVASALPYGQTRQQPATASGYLAPPQAIIDILDAAPTPGVSVSPDRRTVALTYRHSMPTIAEVEDNDRHLTEEDKHTKAINHQSWANLHKLSVASRKLLAIVSD